MKRLLTYIAAATIALTALPTLAKTPKVGFSIDDLRVERWTRDRDYFVAEATKQGAKVSVLSANGNETTQISQIETFITQGMDTIVIVPFNATGLSGVIKEAKKAGIHVIAYDRLILNADLDMYVTFDNVKVGELQAQGLVDVKPKGNYYLIGGSQLDNNAKLFRQGQMNVLQPLADKGDIKILGDQWAKDWLPEEALKITENALTAHENKIDAIVASNDGLAGGAIQALGAQNLAGKVAVSGQDADLDGIHRIVAGTQTTTIYKSLQQLAETAADLAVKMAKNEEMPKPAGTMKNGFKDVPYVLLVPALVTKDNIDKVIIDSGFYTHDQVYGKK